jgi:hypothetical protein
MRTRSKLLLAGLGAALLIAFAVNTAAANRLSIDDQDFDIIWSPLSFAAGGTVTRCNVTLLGSFHSAVISKTAGLLIGHITHGSVEGCNPGASATILSETLPWHVRYASFGGSLPSISSVTLHLVGARFRVDPDGLPACLAGTTAGQPGVGIAEISGGTVTGLRADENAEIDLEDESFICSIGGSAQFSGNGAVEDLELNLLRITLV